MLVAMFVNDRPLKEGDLFVQVGPADIKPGYMPFSFGDQVAHGSVDQIGHPLHGDRPMIDLAANITVRDQQVGIRRCEDHPMGPQWVVLNGAWDEPLVA